MKITNIKQQVKHPDRCSVYVEGRYSFSLPDIEVSNRGLSIGLELTTDELEQLKQDALLSKAYNQALGLIARRPRSQWELETYLLRKGYDIDQTQHVVHRLTALSYVNDRAFAEAWVADRRTFKLVSRRRLRQELRAKRVSDEVIALVLNADETTDADALTELVAKKRRQSRYQDDSKLMQYLARQGFSYEDIKQVLRGSLD